MHESSEKLVSTLAKMVPYVCLFVAIVALVVFFGLGRSDLAIKGLYLAIPVAIASAIAIVKPGLFRKDSNTFLPRVSLGFLCFQHLFLIFVLLYVVSLCFLIGSEARPAGYFILVGAMASLIFVEILGSGEESVGRKGIILFQIVFVSANLVFGETLRLPLYFGWTDVLGHMHGIETILQSGRVTSALGDYQYFPNFHIFGATGTMLSGMSLQTSYFVFNGLVFLISIPVVYLLIGQVTRNVHLPLVTALLYSLSGEVIFNGMYMVTRVMAFVFCLVILYLLIGGRRNWKLRAIAVFLVVPLVLLHQTTLAQFSGILLVLIIIELILYRRSWYMGFNYFAFFTLAYLGYWLWLCYPFLSKYVVEMSSGTTFLYTPSISLERPLLGTFTGNADLTVIAFLGIIGIVSLLYRQRELVAVGTVFVLFSLVAFVVYFPGATSFLAHQSMIYRLPLLVSPFIAFVAAGGLLLLVRRPPTSEQRWKSTTRIGISLCIVFFLALSSTVILGNSTDLNLGRLLGNEERQYFTESEIAAFSFSYEHGENITYYGDHASLRYMGDLLGMSVEDSFDIFHPESITSGYMLFRKQELQSRGQLTFLAWVPNSQESQEYIYKRGESLDLQAIWERENRVLVNAAVQLYMKKTPE